MLVVVRLEAVTLFGCGGWLRVGARAVVTDIVACGDALPAASYASTPTWYAVPHVRPLIGRGGLLGRAHVWLEPR